MTAVPKADEEAVVSTLPEVPSFESDYNRFSNKRKWLIVGIVSFMMFLGPFSGTAVLPAIPNIAADLGTSDTAITYTNAIFFFAMAVSPCIFAPLSQLYGRRPTYIITGIIVFLSSMGTALSPNFASFLACRCLTGLGSAACIVLGGATVADIYRPTERGTAMGILLSGTQLSPAIGPVVVGIIITYQTWRVAFWLLTALTGLGLIFIFFFLPETFHHQFGIRRANGEKVYWIWYNPLRPMILLKYPNLLLTAIASGTLLFSMYTLLTPIRYVLDPRFNLTTSLQAGLFYLAPGCGYFIGTIVGGRYSDIIVRKWIAKKDGRRIPEDRLRAGLIPFATLLPGTVLVYGWCVEKGKGGIPVPVISMFLNAFAQFLVFPSVNTYCTEVMPFRSAESSGSKYFMQFIFAGAASASCLPLIKAIGVGWASTISAFVLMTGAFMVYLVIVFGERMQEWVPGGAAERGKQTS